MIAVLQAIHYIHPLRFHFIFISIVYTYLSIVFNLYIKCQNN